MTQIYREENNIYEFDFSTAVWSTDRIHEIYQSNGVKLLSDVDFAVETENEILLVEYKNANIPGAVNPGQFDPANQKMENKIAYKFYDSWIYLRAIEKRKPIAYVYILEYPNGDVVTRKRVRNQITDLLPFQLQKIPEMKEKMITDFEVLSIDEWNQHKKYGAFPIRKITK
ncbi:MAG: hypothetical protein LUE29_04065 [Lachnospiraceae bacterium]|nr:hypothetical protein [Lachnospiraceae bacterium]